MASRPSSPQRARAASASACEAPAARAQNRTLSATVRSAYRPSWWLSTPTRRRTARGAVTRSSPEHPHLPASEPGEAGAGAQQGGLAGAVRPAEQHDLTPHDVEVDAGEGGEAVQEHDGAGELHRRLDRCGVGGGLHGASKSYR